MKLAVGRDFRVFLVMLLVLFTSEAKRKPDYEGNRHVKTSKTDRESPYDSDALVFRAKNISGLHPSKFMKSSSTPPYKDGQECSTGADRYTPEEIDLVKKHFSNKTIVNSTLDYFHNMKAWRILEGSVDSQWSPKCASGTCYLDEAIQRLTCGKPPGAHYPDGVSCLDGTKTGIKIYPFHGKELSNEQQGGLNRMATKRYGYRCKSRKCSYNSRVNFYTCSSHVSKSVLFFVLILLNIIRIL